MGDTAMSEPLSTPQNEHGSSRVVGISIEPLQVACVSRSLTSDGGDVRVEKVETPPCILLPRLDREPLRLQQSGPRHPRGSGDVWPPEANVPDDISQSPLVPLGLVWNALSRETLAPWSWTTPEGETHSAMAAELIAAAVAGVMPRELVSTPVLVIPNDLKMSRQQALLDACAQNDVKVKLLWRPIAAALPWCEQHAAAVLKQHPGVEGSVGLLLVLHLALDQFELTPLELVAQKQGRKRVLLPARRRPKVATLPSCGVDWLMSTATGSVAEAWIELWTTISFEHRLQTPDCPIETFFDDATSLNWRASLKNQTLPPALSRPQFDAWLRSHREALPQQPLLGVVVTGEVAQVPFARKVSLWRHVLSAQGIDDDVPRLLLSSTTTDCQSSVPLLGQGAASCAAMLASEISPYLDTLPRLKTVTYVGGRPSWIDLLQQDDGWVHGGKTWNRPEPLRGLCIQEGRNEVEVVVSHEEFSTVRKLKHPFREPMERDLAVALHIAVEPAQGNARLRVEPDELHSTLKPIQLEWSRMEDTQHSLEAFVSTLPTLFPPLMRRAASWNRWNNTRVAMQNYATSRSNSALAAVVQSLLLRESVDTNDGAFEARATAISSDGVPGGDQQQAFDAFTEVALARLGQLKAGKEKSELVRALGYSSTDNPRFQEFLSELLSASPYLRQHELVACGWCLRDPSVIGQFAKLLLRRMSPMPEGVDHWLKAFAEILRYREEATRDISSEDCAQLTQLIRIVFQAEHSKRNYQRLFRNSALCIVFLLRRRSIDTDYLPIGSDLHQLLRKTFIEARDTSRRERVMGGAINLPNVLQTMIDYIDRKGPPLLAAGSGFQDFTAEP